MIGFMFIQFMRRCATVSYSSAVPAGGTIGAGFFARLSNIYDRADALRAVSATGRLHIVFKKIYHLSIGGRFGAYSV